MHCGIEGRFRYDRAALLLCSSAALNFLLLASFCSTLDMTKGRQWCIQKLIRCCFEAEIVASVCPPVAWHVQSALVPESEGNRCGQQKKPAATRTATDEKGCPEGDL